MPNINASSNPAKLDLAQERKRAKELLKAIRRDDREAAARFLSHHPRFVERAPDALRAADVKLSDAQLVVARERGFASWPSLKSHIEEVAGRATNGTAPYSVLAWNDDATPMQFVVHMLKEIFQKSDEGAVQIMLDTHRGGVGVCAVYDRLEDAESRIADARALVHQHGHPLELTCANGDVAKKTRRARPLEKCLDTARAKAVRFDGPDMQVELLDGRTLSVPLAWFPQLMSASADQRRRYVLSDQGRVLSWSDFNLIISVSGLLVGPEGQTIRPAFSPARSVEACRTTLAELNRERVPFEWAKAQNDLGHALQFAARGNIAQLEQAIAAHRGALGELNRENAPVEWAKTHSSLGLALLALGSHQSGTARLEEAVAAYRAALAEETRVPLTQWANALLQLGNALGTLGQRESGTARLEEAIEAYCPLLTEEMRERLPFDWALATGQQGVTYMLIAERRSDAQLAEAAAAQIGMAAKAMRDGDYPQVTAYLDEQRSKAGALLDRLSRR